MVLDVLRLPASGAGRFRPTLAGGPDSWPRNAAPTSVAAGCGTCGTGGGRSTELRPPTSAWASRAFRSILWSLRARLLYDRALDWIVLRPADMHWTTRASAYHPHSATEPTRTEQGRYQSLDDIPLHPHPLSKTRPDLLAHSHIFAGHRLQPACAIVVYSPAFDQPLVPLPACVGRLRREVCSLQVRPVLSA